MSKDNKEAAKQVAIIRDAILAICGDDLKSLTSKKEQNLIHVASTALDELYESLQSRFVV